MIAESISKFEYKSRENTQSEEHREKRFKKKKSIASAICGTISSVPKMCNENPLQGQKAYLKKQWQKTVHI